MFFTILVKTLGKNLKSFLNHLECLPKVFEKNIQNHF